MDNEIILKCNPLNNPGDFFACCGLFTFLALEDEGPVLSSFFRKKDGQCSEFVISGRSSSDFKRVLIAISKGKINKSEPKQLQESNIETIILSIGQKKIELNWWLKWTLDDKTPFKIYSGRQKPISGISHNLKALKKEIKNSESQLIFDPKFSLSTKFQLEKKSLFYLDSSAGCNQRQLGYSSNATDQQRCVSLIVEILGMIGLQYFGRLNDNEEKEKKFSYHLWHESLEMFPAIVASNGVDLCLLTKVSFVPKVRLGYFVTHQTTQRKKNENHIYS